MIKALKITGVVVAGLVVLAVVLLVLAKMFITPERIRKAVVPLAEQSLNRKVTVGDIRIRLFSGISIKDLRVQMREGDASFIAADALMLRYQLWPLLKKQVVIDTVRLEKPDIRVIRNADGSFNFSDLLPEKGTAETAGSSALAQASGGPAVNLLVNRLEIHDGRLRFTDRAVGQPPAEYRVTDLSGSASDISLAKPFPFDVTARLNDADLSVSGTLNPATFQVKAEVRAADLNVNDFAPYFRDKIPGRLASARVALEANVSGNPAKMESTGNIRVRDLGLELDALPDAPLRGARCRLDYDVAADMDAQKILIRRADLDVNGIPIQARGRVTQFQSVPSLDITLQMPETRIQQIISAMPENLAAKATGMDPAGTLALDLKIAGRTDQPKTLLKSGMLRLNRIAADAGALRPAVNGVLNLSADRIFAKDMQVQLGSDTISVDFEVTGFYSAPVPIAHRAHAKQLDLDALIASGGGGGKTAKKKPKERGGNRKKAPAEQDIGPFDLPLTVNGRIEADQARYRNLSVSDVMIHYTLVDNVVTVDQISAQMAGGRATGSARVDLGRRGLEYNADFDFSGIQSASVISAFYPSAGSVFSGIADIEARLEGKGVRMESLRQHLSGRSAFRFSDGRIAAPAIAAGLADTLGIRNMESLQFDEFKGDCRLETGKIQINSSYDGKEVKMQPIGTIGLDGRLNLDLNLRLAPDLSTKLSKDSPVARLLADNQGWTQVPLLISGVLSKPRFTLDRAQLQEQLREKATEKVLDKALQKLFE